MSKTRVYVGGLPRDVRERDVENYFRSYGRIREIAMKNGFCFVEFSYQEDADDAIKNLDNRKLLGRRVVVQNARKPRDREQHYVRDRFSMRRSHRFSPARRTNFRVIVENLSSRVQWQDLKDFLTKVGKVTYAKAHNRQPNQGMVEFDTYNDMKRVIREFDGVELKGRKIKIIEISRSRSRSPLQKPGFHSRSQSPVVQTSKPQSKFREEMSNLESERSEPDIEIRRSRFRSPVRKPGFHSRSQSPLVETSNPQSKLREEVSKSILESSKYTLPSLEVSRKRSRENSEDDWRPSFKRSKRNNSKSRSPSD